MAAKTTELSFSELPNEIAQRLTRQFMLDEKPVIVCYNSHRYFYYVVTDRRLISVFVVSKYSNLEIKSVLFTDIVRIDENSAPNFLSFKILTANQQDHLQVSLDGAGELALMFGDAIYRAFNQARSVR
jgi:hypothetical protein